MLLSGVVRFAAALCCSSIDLCLPAPASYLSLAFGPSRLIRVLVRVATSITCAPATRVALEPTGQLDLPRRAPPLAYPTGQAGSKSFLASDSIVRVAHSHSR
eukprot:3202391-Prymnesium_polylepis.1